MPATHLISVDLPAPLSPTRATISPALTLRSTSCSATTAPKCFETSRSSSRASPDAPLPTLTSPPFVVATEGRRRRPSECYAFAVAQMPAFLQSAAYWPWHRSPFLTYPSLITVLLMLAFVTAIGVRR